MAGGIEVVAHWWNGREEPAERKDVWVARWRDGAWLVRWRGGDWTERDGERSAATREDAWFWVQHLIEPDWPRLV